MSSLQRGAKLGLGAALALVAVAGVGFTAPPSQAELQQLPTVRFWHDPT